MRPISVYGGTGIELDDPNGDMRMTKTPTENIPDEIDFENQSHITCPYCGWIEFDSWEYDATDEPETIECGRCSREFDFLKTVTVTYTSIEK